MPSKSELILSPENTVLIVVDIQEKLYAAIDGRREMASQAVKVIKLAKVYNIPIIATEQYPKGLGLTIPKVKDALGDVKCHEKLHYSAFDVESFVKELESTRRKDIILVGIEAHICILQTALELIENGFEVFIAADAVSSRDPENKRLALERMRQHGAEIVVTESVLFEWLRDAAHPSFREVRKLLG